MALIDNLILYWKLDDNLDTDVVLDAHGSNHGTVVNDQNNRSSEQSTIIAKIIRAFLLDGVNDYVTAPAQNPHVNGMEESGLTISLWYKGTSSVTNALVVQGFGNHTWGAYGLFLVGGKARMSAYASGVAYRQATSTTSVNDGAWHHIVGVVDTTNNIVSIYVDGNSEDTDDWLDTDTFESSPSYNNLGIGVAIKATPSDILAGIIDEVGIWNRVLDGDEISSLHNSGDGFAYPFVVGTPDFTDKNNYNGYLAFIQQYIKHRINATTPWANPDGTLL